MFSFSRMLARCDDIEYVMRTCSDERLEMSARLNSKKITKSSPHRYITHHKTVLALMRPVPGSL